MQDILLRFYNSRTKTIETFKHDKSIPVHTYTCGPTVYDRPHLGNLKTFVWSDFVVQLLQCLGYIMVPIMNVTDIDDKILDRLPLPTMESLKEFTNTHTVQFLQDMHILGIRNYTTSNIFRVTDHLKIMEDMATKLLQKGFAYETADGSVYFDSTQIQENPFFQKNDIEGYQPFRNILRSKDVKNPRDFVLWKVKRDRPLSFFFNGKSHYFPGWHLECSAIVDHHLDKLHIAMGGMDLQCPHHMCSISQSEALKPYQKYGDYWIHFGFLNFTGDKMSKSTGNVKHLCDISHPPRLVRMYLLSKSYRHTFEYNENEIEMMKKDFINFHLLYNKLKYRLYKSHPDPAKNYCGNTKIYYNLLTAVADQFNVAHGFKLLITYVDQMMKVYLTHETASSILQELTLINHLFQILDHDVLSIDQKTFETILKREEFRERKEYEMADTLRQQLQQTFIFEDEKTGCSIIKKWNV